MATECTKHIAGMSLLWPPTHFTVRPLHDDKQRAKYGSDVYIHTVRHPVIQSLCYNTFLKSLRSMLWMHAIFNT